MFTSTRDKTILLFKEIKIH